MKKLLKEKWVVPVATLVLTLSIGSAAFAATGSSSTHTSAVDTSTAVTSTATSATSTDAAAPSAPAGASATNPWGNQRSDETLLTGTTLDQVKAVALAKIGSDSTIVRVETDADGHAAYEVHMLKADGTPVTVYVDESFNFVSTEDRPAGGHAGGPADATSSSSTATDSTSTSSN